MLTNTSWFSNHPPGTTLSHWYLEETLPPAPCFPGRIWPFSADVVTSAGFCWCSGGLWIIWWALQAPSSQKTLLLFHGATQLLFWSDRHGSSYQFWQLLCLPVLLTKHITTAVKEDASFSLGSHSDRGNSNQWCWYFTAFSEIALSIFTYSPLFRFQKHTHGTPQNELNDSHKATNWALFSY